MGHCYVHFAFVFTLKVREIRALRIFGHRDVTLSKIALK